MQSIVFLLVVLLLGITLSNAFFHGTLPRSAQASRGFLEMRERKCDISGKRRNGKAMAVSKSMRHTHRVQNVNLQWCKLWWEEGKKFVRVRIATKTLRSIRKNGLHAVAKEHGINLEQYAISAGTAPAKTETLASV